MPLGKHIQERAKHCIAIWGLKEKSERKCPANTKVREEGSEVSGALGAGAETKTIYSESYVNEQPKWTQTVWSTKCH